MPGPQRLLLWQTAGQESWMTDKNERVQGPKDQTAPHGKEAKVQTEAVSRTGSTSKAAGMAAGVGKKSVVSIFLLVTILYVSLNLRAPLIGVGPVIDSIRVGLGLDRKSVV